MIRYQVKQYTVYIWGAPKSVVAGFVSNSEYKASFKLNPFNSVNQNVNFLTLAHWRAASTRNSVAAWLHDSSVVHQLLQHNVFWLRHLQQKLLYIYNDLTASLSYLVEEVVYASKLNSMWSSRKPSTASPLVNFANEFTMSF